MSCEDYCPEVHNDPDFEVVETSDTDSEVFEPEPEPEESPIQEMIKKEMADKMKVPNKGEHPSFKALNDTSFKDLPDDEKIKLVAKAFWDTGGIDMENILELKMLMVLIGATESMEGFKNFPREQVYKLLEMIIYHANKHMEILNI